MMAVNGRKIIGFMLTALCAMAALSACEDDHYLGPQWPSTEHHVENLEESVDGSGLAYLDVRAQNGSTHVNGSDSGLLTIHVRKDVSAHDQQTARDFAAQVDILIVQDGDVLRVRCEYPKPPHGVNVRVDFEIDAPRQLDLGLLTLNGVAAVDGVRGAVKLTSVNGRVDARLDELAKPSSFSTMNGSIFVTVLSGVADLSAIAVQGSINLAIPDSYSGRLNARTLNGRVRCGIPVIAGGCNNPNCVQGVIGQGGPATLDLSVTNGNIDLKWF